MCHAVRKTSSECKLESRKGSSNNNKVQREIRRVLERKFIHFRFVLHRTVAVPKFKVTLTSFIGGNQNVNIHPSIGVLVNSLPRAFFLFRSSFQRSSSNHWKRAEMNACYSSYMWPWLWTIERKRSKLGSLKRTRADDKTHHFFLLNGWSPKW